MFLLVPAHPGFPGQIPQSRKTVVCVSNYYTNVSTTKHYNGTTTTTTVSRPPWLSVSGSGINWAICKSASRPRQATTPASHHSVFYRPNSLKAQNIIMVPTR